MQRHLASLCESDVIPTLHLVAIYDVVLLISMMIGEYSSDKAVLLLLIIFITPVFALTFVSIIIFFASHYLPEKMDDIWGSDILPVRLRTKWQVTGKSASYQRNSQPVPLLLLQIPLHVLH